MFRSSRVALNVKISSKLTVYLGSIASIEWPAPIRRRIQEHFEKVVKKSSSFQSVSVAWTSRKPKLAAHDLLVYFVSSPDASVVTGLHPSAHLGDSGTTVVGSKGDVASEVYVSGSQNDPKGLGNLAFHELMHNVTLMRQELHTQPLISLAKESITADTPLSSGDVALMARNLKKSRRQWTDGF